MKKFMSFDPSLRNTAIVFGETDLKKLVPKNHLIIGTKPMKNNKGKKIFDIYQRYKVIYRSVTDQVEAYDPEVVFFETPSGAQSFDSSAAFFGSLFLAATIDKDLHLVKPKEVKKLTHGSEKATKHEMTEYVQKNYPDFNIPLRKLKGEMIVNMSKAEHICDAVCIAEACLKKYYD